MTRPITSLEIGEESAGKKLGKFGSATVQRPVSAARRQADIDELFAQAQWEKLS